MKKFICVIMLIFCFATPCFAEVLNKDSVEFKTIVKLAKEINLDKSSNKHKLQSATEAVDLIFPKSWGHDIPGYMNVKIMLINQVLKEM